MWRKSTILDNAPYWIFHTELLLDTKFYKLLYNTLSQSCAEAKKNSKITTEERHYHHQSSSLHSSPQIGAVNPRSAINATHALMIPLLCSSSLCYRIRQTFIQTPTMTCTGCLCTPRNGLEGISSHCWPAGTKTICPATIKHIRKLFGVLHTGNGLAR